MANEPDVAIEPAWKVSLVYGMPCSILCRLPEAYYLAARFRDNFEQAVLHAINGGSQNMSRAMLTGALRKNEGLVFILHYVSRMKT